MSMVRKPQMIQTITAAEQRTLELDVKDSMRARLFEENIDEFWEVLYAKEEALHRVTEVSKNEVPMYDAAVWFSEMFDLPWIKDLVRYDLSLRISIDRKGRTEATQVMVGTTPERKKASIFGGLFRKKGEA